MFDLRIFNTSDEEITEIALGDIEYPYSLEEEYYIKNVGVNPVDTDLFLGYALSIQNFTANCILDAYILNPHKQFTWNYSELLFKYDNIVSDIYNFSEKNINVSRDEDEYVRNLVPNTAIKFGDMRKNSSGRILLSSLRNYAFVDYIDKTSYKKTLQCGIIDPNEEFPFYLKIELQEGITGEQNPYKLNLILRGQEQ